MCMQNLELQENPNYYIEFLISHALHLTNRQKLIDFETLAELGKSLRNIFNVPIIII